jgi:5-methyltetrahydropteroyltriglutamate--homocysteine methyltransferase
MTSKPVKFGTISATTLAAFLQNEYYPDDKALLFDLCDIMNAELRELAAAGCPIIQIEEPRHHYLAIQPNVSAAMLDLETEAFNRLVRGVEAEIWVHTCWGNPNQQRLYRDIPSYEPALPSMLELDADVLTFECASSHGRDLAAIGRHSTDKTIGIGVVNHTTTLVETPDSVADLIRRALEHIPPERLLITTDCGFGREGISRRIAFYKCVSLVQGTNIVRRELGRLCAPVRAADPRLAFDYRPEGKRL